jgi:hypothetical protein
VTTPRFELQLPVEKYTCASLREHHQNPSMHPTQKLMKTREVAHRPEFEPGRTNARLAESSKDSSVKTGHLRHIALTQVCHLTSDAHGRFSTCFPNLYCSSWGPQGGLMQSLLPSDSATSDKGQQPCILRMNVHDHGHA